MKRSLLSALAALLLGTTWASAQVVPASPGTQSLTRSVSLINYDAGAEPGGPVQNLPPSAPPNVVIQGSQGNGNVPTTQTIISEGQSPDWTTEAQPAGARIWGGVEYLLWNVKDSSLPRLTAAIPAGLASVNANFVVNQQIVNQTVLVPVSILSDPQLPNAGNLNLGDHSGARFTIGAWLNDDQTFGIEGSIFVLEERGLGFASSNGTALNQFTVNTQVVVPTFAGSLNVVFPTQSDSSLVGTARTEVWGGEVNAVVGSLNVGPLTFRGRTGLRFLELEEQLNINNTITLTPVATGAATQFPVPAANGTPFVQFSTFDNIHTWNRFYGANIGADMDANFGGWFINVRGQVALGALNQRVRIFGLTDFSANGIPQTRVQSGLLSGPSDQGGARSRTRIAVVPEVIVKFGYQFCEWFRVFVHYDAFYVQNAVRPGNITQVDTSSTQITVSGTQNQFTVQQPVIVLSEFDTWVRGVGLGAEVKW